MPDFQLLFATSFFIFGMNYVLGSPTINDRNELVIFPALFSFIPVRLFRIWKSGKELFKPLFLCPVCMASVWGTASYLLFSPHYDLIQWAVFLVALAGLNRLLLNFI